LHMFSPEMVSIFALKIGTSKSKFKSELNLLRSVTDVDGKNLERISEYCGIRTTSSNPSASFIKTHFSKHKNTPERLYHPNQRSLRGTNQKTNFFWKDYQP